MYLRLCVTVNTCICLEIKCMPYDYWWPRHWFNLWKTHKQYDLPPFFIFFTMIILMIMVTYIFWIVVRHLKWQPDHSPVLTQHCGDLSGNSRPSPKKCSQHRPRIRAGNTGMSSNTSKGALRSFWMKSTGRFTFSTAFSELLYTTVWFMLSITKRICLQVLTISLGKIFEEKYFT